MPKSSRNGPVVIVRAPRELKDIDVRDAVASVVDGICEEFELSGRAMRDRVARRDQPPGGSDGGANNMRADWWRTAFTAALFLAFIAFLFWLPN